MYVYICIYIYIIYIYIYIYIHITVYIYIYIDDNVCISLYNPNSTRAWPTPEPIAAKADGEAGADGRERRDPHSAILRRLTSTRLLQV